VARLLGAAAVFLGGIIIGFNPNDWDPVLLGLPRGGHGIHVTDLVGIAILTIGVVLLWRAAARRDSPSA
jgi:hypothetical protein